jgi:hypothetical protein
MYTYQKHEHMDVEVTADTEDEVTVFTISECGDQAGAPELWSAED